MRINPIISQKLAIFILFFLTGTALLILFFIVSFVLINGLPAITGNFLFGEIEEMGRSGGIFSTIINTIYLTALAILIATPLGVGSAVYLTEYRQESNLTKIVRFGAECLAGIPSIIFGLFGFVLFVVYFKLGWSALSGSLTLSCMILPTIIRTSEEAIKAVPSNLREVSLSLGASKWQTITRVVLPKASPGILTGIILSIGRSIGETAAVIFTAGSALRGRTMSVHFYILAREGISMKNAYGVAAVLVFSILVINLLAYVIMHRLTARYG